MRLNQLLNEQVLNEMPYLKQDHQGNSAQLKMDTSGFDHFFSEDTLAELFKLVDRKGDEVVYIREDHTMAFIGQYGTREDDNKPGAHVIITLDFKHPQMISNTNPGLELPGALQVDLVVANKPKLARSGAGSKLYMALVQKLGVTIISDNTQYRGGKMLWKNLAARQGGNGYEVNVIDDGKPIMDDNGKPFVYDGKNLHDDELWSARPLPKTMNTGLTPAGVELWHADRAKEALIPDKTMTLFIMRRK